MVLHIHVNLAKDMDLIQVAIKMVSKKSEKKEYFGQFVQSSNWILCIYKYVCVGKNGMLILGMNTIYLTHISPQFISPKFKLLPKAKKPPSIL